MTSMCLPIVMWFCDAPSLSYNDEEEVALLIGVRWRRHYMIRSTLHVDNQHKEPSDFFSVSSSQVPSRLDGYVVGVIHSHPNDDESPSLPDIAGIRKGWIGAVHSGGRISSWYDHTGELSVDARKPRRNAGAIPR